MAAGAAGGPPAHPFAYPATARTPAPGLITDTANLFFANKKTFFMDQRIMAPAAREGALLAAAGLTLDRGTREVRRDGKKLRLEHREYQLLEYLLRNKNRIVSREEILREIWGKDIMNHTLDARMSALRKKIDQDFPVKILYTISRKGYLLTDPT